MNTEKIEQWNCLRPVGTPCSLVLDDGTQVETRVRSEAWLLGSGRAVVKIEGYPGGWDISRIRFEPVVKLEPAQKEGDEHNPERVDKNSVPAGRRFMRRNEIRRRREYYWDIWCWNEDANDWEHNYWKGNSLSITYCVPIDWVEPEPGSEVVK